MSITKLRLKVFILACVSYAQTFSVVFAMMFVPSLSFIQSSNAQVPAVSPATGEESTNGLFPSPDFHQCDRRCRDEFSAQEVPAKIRAVKVDENLCRCFNVEGKTLGVISRKYRVNPPQLGQEVCGLDQKTYESVAAADAAQVLPIHGGPCGRCSNLPDLRRYHVSRNTLTKDTIQCAVQLTFFGEAASRSCIAKQGFTPDCTYCWQQNIECTRVHCFDSCIKSRLFEVGGDLKKNLNDCLRCEEAFCRTPLIECAGANRQRAGIPSDFDRPGEQLWLRPHPVPGLP